MPCLRWLAGLALLLLLAAPALAQGVTVKVTVKDAAGKPVEGAKVTVVKLQASRPLPYFEGKTDAGGGVTATHDLKAAPLKSGVYEIKVQRDQTYTSTVIFIPPGGKAAFSPKPTQFEPLVAGYELREQAEEAKKSCDRKAYDEAVSHLKAQVREYKRLVAEYDAAIEAFKKASKLTEIDKEQAKKLLEANKADKSSTAAPLNAEAVQNLQNFLRLLYERGHLQELVEVEEEHLKQVPSFTACPKPGEHYVLDRNERGSCPPGYVRESGSVVTGVFADIGVPMASGCVRRTGQSDREHEHGDHHDK